MRWIRINSRSETGILSSNLGIDDLIMAILQCFILPFELDRWIQELASAKGLIGYCQYATGDYVLLNNLQINSIFTGERVVKLFLLPDAHELFIFHTTNDFRPRDMGWLDVHPGQLILEKDRSVLTLTTIQAEDKKNLSFRPSAWIRWLKRQFSSSITFGVEIVNIKSGEKDVIKDISYSSEALRLSESGTIWKQYVDGNAAFYPLKT